MAIAPIKKTKASVLKKLANNNTKTVKNSPELDALFDKVFSKLAKKYGWND